MRMSALAPAPARCSRVTRENAADSPCLRLRIETVAAEVVVDVTAHLESFVERSGVVYGVLVVHTLHTTTAVVVNENEPLLHEDLLVQLERLAPRGRAYAHDDERRRVVNRQDAERTNGHAHCRALLLGSSVSLPIVDGRLQLGRWQRVLFIELDGPQERRLVATISGAGR